MAGYRSSQLHVPTDEAEFEKNCAVLFRDVLNDPTVERLGTRGQAQDGVDIVGHRNRDPKQLVGIQCKLKSGQTKLTSKEVREEVKKALGYRPELKEYFIVATSKDDTKLRQLAQQLMQEQETVGRRIAIEVWGFDTLQDRVSQSEGAKNAFDPGFSPSIETQNRKLDGLLDGQARLATSDQIVALQETIEKASSEVPTRLPQSYADQELKRLVARTLRRTGFAKSNTSSELRDLAERAIEGDLVLGSSAIRAEICDRAARANSDQDHAEIAQRFRACAATLDPSRDLFIADALMHEARGDPDGTLRELRTREDRDTRSALFTSLIRQRGSESALDWLRSEGLEPSSFNAPATTNLVLQIMDTGDFHQALETISKIEGPYFDECPALRLLRAQLTVASILPVDQKGILFKGLPFDPKRLQLAGGAKAHQKIRAAVDDIRALLGVADELGLEYLVNFISEFELWLRLEDPDSCQSARQQLTRDIGDPNKTLRRVRLALSYDVPFNQEALQRHLIAQKELGGWTPDQRFAAFLIAYHSRDSRKLIDFFEQHRDDLFGQTDLDRSALAGLETELLARAGRFDEARARLALHRGTHLTDDQLRDIEEGVEHIEKGDEVEGFRQRYVETKSLSDLRVLVAGLRAKRNTRQLAVYAPVLVLETRAREDFELAIKSLFRLDRFAEVVALAEELPDLVEIDDEYVALKGWSLHQLGRVMEARAIARTLRSRRHARIDRELAINTAIESGDWGNLQSIVAQEAERIDTLSVAERIRLARLSLEVGSPYVDQFRDAALRDAPDDPQVNLMAYMLALERGDEYQGSKAHEWFQKAAEQSGPDGPVQSVPMQEVVRRSGGWNERVENVERMLRNAEIPLFLTAKALNRQLMDLTIGQAYRNTAPNEKRMKYPVFAFSGALTAHEVPLTARIALDITSLITLDYLRLLETALVHCQNLTIGPSTLGSLFTERQFIKIQQPSQIARAGRIRALISSGRLQVLPADAEPMPGLASQVGRDLAALLSAAQRDGGIVVRSAPVARVGTFLEESVDMGAQSALLTDTLSVLSFLSAQGKIDSGTRKAAETYLRRVDKGWSAPAPVDPSSTLYLDDLTVTYLDYVGLLDALAHTVRAVFIHADLDTETQQWLQAGKNADELLNAIERIRGVLSGALESGRVSFSTRRLKDERGEDREEDKDKGKDEDEDEDDESLTSSPALDLMSNLTNIDAVASDDRCLNKLPIWSDGRGQNAAAITTLHILTALKSSGGFDEEGYYRARHQLRAAGYYAVPWEAAELQHHVMAAPIVEKMLRETPELKALREALLLPLMNNTFIAAEEKWLNGVRFSVYKALRDLWQNDPDLEKAEARANWLLSILPDPLTWCPDPENDAIWQATRQQAANQAAILSVFLEGTDERRRRYFAWLAERYIEPLQKEHSELSDAAVEFLKHYVARLMEADRET